MKYSALFGKTVKTTPSNIKSRSNQLLYKGGFIRQISAGRYSFLPLGFRVWEKILNIVEEEMAGIGSQRIITPTFHPIKFWKATNRDRAFGDEMHIISDHHGAVFALSGTAEGMMVEVVKEFSPSYKQFPIYLHQYSTKFRDEKRPRGGLLRVREFVMKDAYSFDTTEKNLLKSYKKFFNAYKRIAKRLDLNARPVISHSGAIGGDYNHEFIVESDIGESLAFVCGGCEYAAHEDVAEAGFKKYPQDKKMKKVGEHISRKAVKCELLAEEMGIPLNVTTKTILFKTERGFVAAMVRGDYDINEVKLKDYLGVNDLNLASEEEIKKLTGAEMGFLGPVNLPPDVEIIADTTCKDRVNFEIGGNKTGVHLYNINFERDLDTPKFHDIRKVKEGDKCSKCKKGIIKKMRGIEFGHVFKLDLFYSKPMGGNFVDEDGEIKPFWMGSYGIGIGRTMATIVETHNDGDGIIWPDSVSPFDVHLLNLGSARRVGQETRFIYKTLTAEGIDVLWDDRDASSGEKLKDMDLIGIPVRIVVSDSTVSKGVVEISGRKDKKKSLVKASKVLDFVKTRSRTR